MLRFGLIGCGRIAERHIQTLAQCKGATLVAVCDVVVKRMEEMIRKYQSLKHATDSIQQTQDYHEMLDDPNIDAVIIATLSGLHAEATKIALVANKHVIVEKPMALSIGDANDIIELAAIKKRIVLVCHQLRYRPLMVEIKKLIQQHALGELYYGAISVRLNRSPSYYRSASWRGTWDQDGGMLINQGIHLIDLLNWFFGDVKSVFGEVMQCGIIQKQTEDIAIGLINYHNQAKALLEVNTITPRQYVHNSLTIFAEKGTISIGGKALDQIDVWDVQGEQRSKEELQSLTHNQDEHVRMYEDFIHAVQSNSAHVLMNAKEGKCTLETILALYQSSISRQMISLPLLSFSTASMGRL